MYEPARVVRLDLSIHSGVKAFSTPFKPGMLEYMTWEGIRERQKSPRYIAAIAGRHPGTWGRIIEPEKYLGIMGFLLKLGDSDLKPGIELPKRRSLSPCMIAGLRRINDPQLGEVEYDARLEGFGWVETLVKEKIPVGDGRLAFCWAILPVAIKGPKTGSGDTKPLITWEEAVTWLTESLKQFPDPEKRLEDYLKKLEYNLRYGDRYNIPTWRHLIGEKTAEESPLAEVFKHIKYPVIHALHQAKLINLTPSQQSKLENMLKTPAQPCAPKEQKLHSKRGHITPETQTF